MAKPISPEKRLLLVKAVFENGLSRRAAAAQFKVSVASAVRWCHRWQESGKVDPLPMGGDRRSGLKQKKSQEDTPMAQEKAEPPD